MKQEFELKKYVEDNHKVQAEIYGCILSGIIETKQRLDKRWSDIPFYKRIFMSKKRFFGQLHGINVNSEKISNLLHSSDR